MLYIVDGTGPHDQKVYEKKMRDSFCLRMSRIFKGHYYRGPELWGGETYHIADRVYARIKNDRQLGREPLFLAGHSRGGAAMIHVASRLKRDRQWVDALFLFDAVDRTMSTTSVRLIPRNVKVTFHARRDIQLATCFERSARTAKLEWVKCIERISLETDLSKCDERRQLAIKYQRLDDAMKVRMRTSLVLSISDGISVDFGNCGVGLMQDDGWDAMAKACRYEESFFLGSHGALGGTPIGEQDGAWKSEVDKHLFRSIRYYDRDAMTSVWAWMSKNFEDQLARHGLPSTM